MPRLGPPRGFPYTGDCEAMLLDCDEFLDPLTRPTLCQFTNRSVLNVLTMIDLLGIAISSSLTSNVQRYSTRSGARVLALVKGRNALQKVLVQ